MTEQQRQEAVSLYQKGVKISVICTKFDVDRRIIQRLMNSRGVERRGKGWRPLGYVARGGKRSYA